MQLKRAHSDPRLPLRIQGCIRFFCRPLRVIDSGQLVNAVMAPTSRAVPSPSLTRKGRFSSARRMDPPRFDGCRDDEHPPLIHPFDDASVQAGEGTLSFGTFFYA